MSLQFHEISEANHRILNPFTLEKLMLVGEICTLDSDSQVLDLCCGKAEMLCQWAKQWDIQATGVDISSVFIDAATARVQEMKLGDNISLIQADAKTYQSDKQTYDVVSCIGATWIGDGLVGTLELMKPALKPDGMILVGEPYWKKPPPEELYGLMDVEEDTFTSLIGTLDRIEACEMELVEMVLADGDNWDRYVASQWLTVDSWLRDNPAHELQEKLRDWNAHWKRTYLEYERDYFGWGIFVIRLK